MYAGVEAAVPQAVGQVGAVQVPVGVVTQPQPVQYGAVQEVPKLVQLDAA